MAEIEQIAAVAQGVDERSAGERLSRARGVGRLAERRVRSAEARSDERDGAEQRCDPAACAERDHRLALSTLAYRDERAAALNLG
jgi:hypothetical protein